ncbi:MAG: hypothetical protein KAW47_03600 [Thermoplasmatales archaeon]|nr:hypothetical protein [Thermoplasmatales archaeon]
MTKLQTSKIIIQFLVLLSLIVTASSPQILATQTPGEIYSDTISMEYKNVTVYAPAVGQTENGYIGVISTITVTIQSNGSGRVFVDTLPLAQIDMQGSARLAVKVASALAENDKRCEVNPSEYDYFFIIRTSAPIIGGPSAGGIMTAAVASLLEGWTMDSKTVMTGMINPDGSIGPIGGIPKKIDAAYSVGATRFLIPKGQMTYTDTIVETVTDNGWTQTTTKTITKNVSEYAMENYDMEVFEVEDINDVLLHYTGWGFPVVESNDSITTENYIDSMKPLATTLLDQAGELYKNASDSFNNSDIPNYYPYYRNQVTDFLNDAEDALTESEDWFEQDLYYTSTSKSFQSLINSQFVTYACEYFNVDNKDDYIHSLLQNSLDFYSNQSILAKNAEINGTTSLQCVGAAQKRASDAGSYLSDAEMKYQNGDDFSALYKIAYAMQRSESIGWWLGLTSQFNDTGTINSQELNDLAGDYIQDAQQAVVYSGVILQEMRRSSSYLIDAESILENARKDKENGYPAAALFEALESLSKANLALELVDGVTKDKIDRANESAHASISESRLRGIEPILAVSYYEYAQSLVEDSADIAMFYYKYSALIPGILTFTGTYGDQSSRYVGIPESNFSVWSHGIMKYKEFFILFAVIGGIGGIGLGILIGSIQSKKEKEKIYKTWAPKSTLDYYNQKNQHFSEGQMPRSIEDYYKKSGKHK